MDMGNLDIYDMLVQTVHRTEQMACEGWDRKDVLGQVDHMIRGRKVA